MEIVPRVAKSAALDSSSHDGQSVFATLGFVQLIVGLGSVIAADFSLIFDLLAVAAALLGAISLVYCVTQPASVKVYDLLSAALLLAYGSGTFVSFVSYAASNQDLVHSSLVSQYWLTRTLGLAVAAAGFLHLAGRVDSDGYLLRARTESSQSSSGSRVFWFSSLVCLVYIFMLLTRRIGFMGAVSAGTDDPSVSPLAVFVLALVTPAGALALNQSFKYRAGMRLRLLLISGALLLLQFGLGRRVFVFSVVTYGMSALFAWKPKRFLTIKNILLLVVVLVSIEVVTTAFYALRMASWSLGKQDSSQTGVLELIPRAYKIYRDDRGGDLQASIRQNVKTRTFVLEYLAQISEGEDTHGALLGEDLHRAIVFATPSIFYEEKFRDKLFMEEESLINPRFGLPIWDAANSIMTAGVADFGPLGMFLYPLALCAVLSTILRAAKRWSPSIVAMFVGLSICQTLLTVEIDVAGYLAVIRVTVLIAIAAWMFFAVGNRSGAVGASLVSQ